MATARGPTFARVTRPLPRPQARRLARFLSVRPVRMNHIGAYCIVPDIMLPMQRVRMEARARRLDMD